MILYHWHPTLLQQYPFALPTNLYLKPPIKHPNIRAKHCTYGHRIATLLNPHGVTIVSHKYSLTLARHATVVMAVPSTIDYPAN
jgi:hypothetical protein